MDTFYPVVRTVVKEGTDLPLYAKNGDAAADLCATKDVTLMPGEWKMVGSGMAAAIPEGFVGLVVPRSGMGCKGLVLKNGIGVIDSGYRGEIGLTLYNNNPTHRYFPADDTMGGEGECYEENFDPIHVRKGDRVAQLMIVPVAHAMFVKVDSLDETERGSGSFGSTGIRYERL